MSGHPLVEELETLPLTAGVAAHVAQCDACARELAWLRAERALLSRRPAPPVQQLWAGIEARLSDQPRLRRQFQVALEFPQVPGLQARLQPGVEGGGPGVGRVLLAAEVDFP